MKVNKVCGVFAPAVSKDLVARSVSRGPSRIGWHPLDVDIHRKREYMSILVGFSLTLVAVGDRTYNMRREGL